MKIPPKENSSLGGPPAVETVVFEASASPKDFKPKPVDKGFVFADSFYFLVTLFSKLIFFVH